MKASHFLTWSVATAALGSCVVLDSCGYRPLYGGERDEGFCVIGTTPLVADASVVSEVQAGIRSGLARAGALRPGGAYPCVIVEVLRMDATSEGIAAVPGGNRPESVGGLPISPGGPPLPLARGTRVGLLARAWVERTPGAAHERETGDLRTTDVMQAEADARLETLRRDDAVRAGARRLGQRLARRVLGEPDAPDDGM